MKFETHVDDRGALDWLIFPDDFNPVRIYKLTNFSLNTIRGWHGHMSESKLLFVSQGGVKVAVRNLVERRMVKKQTYVQVVSAGEYLLIEARNTHAWRALTCDTQLYVLSDRLPDLNDDIRDKVTKQDEKLFEVVNR